MKSFGALVLVLAFVAPGCSGGTGNQKAQGGGTVVFGLLQDPFTLDGPIARSIPSFEVVSQIFETLVRTEPGTTMIGPLLARTWESTDGQTWTFHLEHGVKFHDGTAFDARAVCFNFERWYHFTGLLQTFARWPLVFGAFATPSDQAPPTTLYAGCDAPVDDQVVLRLTRPYGELPATLTQPAFSIASPDALRRYDADRISGSKETPVFDSPFGTQHPIGTGPFRFKSWTRNERLEVVRNDDYWGRRPTPDRIIFRPIADGTARRQSLESGEIQGYAPVDAGDVKLLRDKGFPLVELPAINTGIVALNLTKPPLDNPKVRQAVAYALNREAVVNAKFPSGTEVATQLIPPALPGHGPAVPEYRYDPELAKRLLTESGVANPALELWYPTFSAGLAEPLLPDTEGMFLAFKADLERVGFRVVGKPTPYLPDYYNQALPSGAVQVFLVGLYASRPSPEEIFAPFGPQGRAVGFDKEEVVDALGQARADVDPAKQAALYQKANRLVMESVMAVPYAHVKVYVALSPKIHGFKISAAATDPDFSSVTLK
ncbi:MAG: ABC transporter substrate-binding protein [Actinobacteria bacterium]|nr:ABC transporter substrate-binding protein [Actinomycetota bacterium]